MSKSWTRCVWLTIVLLLLPFMAWSQRYEGRVTDDQGQPIKSVSVLLLGESNRPVCFTKTQTDGLFRVSVPQGKPAKNIMFSCLNYAKDTLSLSMFRQGQTVILKEQTTEIKNVVVKSSRIRQTGDTLDYMVNSFRQKQDRTIADVLRKMPGIDVDKNGAISYQGTRINKFYIEGMDLLGAKYVQASENMPADYVKKVQVMEHHQPVKMLRDVVFSEQAALNLVLTDSAKNVWQGMADVAAGTTANSGNEWLGDVKLTEMLFARMKQSVSMYKYNNTGKDIGKEINAIAILDNGAPTEREVVQGVEVNTPPLDDHRTLFNETHVFATNWLFKPSADADFRIQIDGKTDHTKWGQHTETFYVDVDDGKMVVEEMAAYRNRSQLSADATYQLNGDHIYLTNTMKGFLHVENSRGNTQWNNQPVTVRTKPRRYYLNDRLHLIRRLQGNGSVSASAYVSANHLPSRMVVADGTLQYLDADSWFWGASADRKYRLWGLQLGHAIDYQAKQQRGTSTFQALTSDFCFETHQVKVVNTISYNRKSWKLNANVGVVWLGQRLDSVRLNRSNLDINLQAIWQPTSRWQLSSTYRQTVLPIDGWNTTGMSYYTTYYLRHQGPNSIVVPVTRNISFDIKYKDVMKGYFASVHAQWNHKNHQRLYHHSIDEAGYHSMATTMETDMDGWNILSRLSKTLRWSRMFMSLSCHWSCDTGRILLNEECVGNRNAMLTTNFHLALQPSDWLSLTADSYWLQSVQHQNVNGGVSSTHNSFAHLLKIYVMPGRWRLEWNNEFYHSNDGSVSANYFADVRCFYKSKMWEAGVELNNVFDRSNYQWFRLSANRRVTVINPLRSRELMFRLKFSF